MTIASETTNAAGRTIVEAAAALRAGTLTSVELVRECLDLADAADDEFGVFITRMDEAAIERAAAADEQLANGTDLGPLHGIPFGLKDILSTADAPTTAQSLVLDPQWGVDQGDATVVSRLRSGGAVFVGKTATMEFAIGFADPDKPFPIHRNPWNSQRWTGGSSAGSGSGVAAGMCLGALGTDTGGSIRIPAAFCGISGLKPTFGRVPSTGCVPLGYSLDHIGPMARSSADCAAILDVIADKDESESFAPHQLTGDLSDMTIGVDRANHLSADNIEPGTVEVFERSVEELIALGATVVDVELPLYAEATMADLIIMVSEAMSYHSLDFQSRWEDYGAPTRRVLGWSMAYSAADYVQAQRVRQLAGRGVAALLEEVDAIVHPTALFGAPVVDTTVIDDWFDWPLFTGYGNSVGLPVLSVPMGFTADGLPLGLSIMTGPDQELGALTVGHGLQSQTDYHLKRPEPMPV